MKRPLDIASSGHRAQNQLAMNDPPPVLIDLHSASSRRESQNAFRRRKKGTVATRPHSSALGRTSGPASALKLGRRNVSPPTGAPPRRRCLAAPAIGPIGSTGALPVLGVERTLRFRAGVSQLDPNETL